VGTNPLPGTKNEDGIRVAAEITKLRRADIAFDSRTLRVIAEAEGAINVYVTALPARTDVSSSW
jgi:hypothetical protein